MRISDWSSDVCSSDLGKKNAGAFAPASSCIFRWNAGSERVAHAQVGATRFHPVGRLAEGIDTVACDQVLLGTRGLLVEVVDQVEEEIEIADRPFPRVLEIVRASCRDRVCQSA